MIPTGPGRADPHSWPGLYPRQRRWELSSSTHCKDTITKIWNEYSQERNCEASVPISTFMCLWAIYILPQSVCLFCCRKICGPILGICKSLTDTCGNWGWGRAISFLEIHKWDFFCSARTNKEDQAVFFCRIWWRHTKRRNHKSQRKEAVTILADEGRGGGKTATTAKKTGLLYYFLFRGPNWFLGGGVHIPQLYEEFIIPDWGDKDISGIGLSLYRPARLPYAGGPVRQP